MTDHFICMGKLCCRFAACVRSLVIARGMALQYFTTIVTALILTNLTTSKAGKNADMNGGSLKPTGKEHRHHPRQKL